MSEGLTNGRFSGKSPEKPANLETSLYGIVHEFLKVTNPAKLWSQRAELLEQINLVVNQAIESKVPAAEIKEILTRMDEAIGLGEVWGDRENRAALSAVLDSVFRRLDERLADIEDQNKKS